MKSEDIKKAPVARRFFADVQDYFRDCRSAGMPAGIHWRAGRNFGDKKAKGGTQAPDADGPRTTPFASLASSPFDVIISDCGFVVNSRDSKRRRQKVVRLFI